MSILSLSPELLLQISTHITRQDSLYSLALVSHYFHSIFNIPLYKFNLTHRHRTSLFWAIKTGHTPLLVKILSLLPKNTNLNTLPSPRDNFYSRMAPLMYFYTLMKFPLYLATLNGHAEIITLLCEKGGADPNIRQDGGASLLYAALVSRNDLVIEQIVKVIGWENLASHVAVTYTKSTPLHVACQFGLSRWVQFFLEAGVDVDARDRKGWTALRHVVELDYERFWERDGEGTWGVDGIVPGVEEVRDTVRVLVGWGADPVLEMGERWDWGARGWRVGISTAAGVGKKHFDRDVRGLFEGSREDGFSEGELAYLDGREHLGALVRDSARIGVVSVEGGGHSLSFVGERPVDVVPPTSNMDRLTLISSLRISSRYFDLRPKPGFTDYMDFEEPVLFITM